MKSSSSIRGSADKTKQVAKKYTDKLYDFSWCDDFSKARNFSFSKASMEYCMWLDADDVVEDEDIEKIQKLKKELDKKVSIVQILITVPLIMQNTKGCNNIHARVNQLFPVCCYLFIRNSDISWYPSGLSAIT